MKNFVKNKVRYLRQTDTYACTALALLNLDKWRGLRVTRKNLSEYKKLCRSHKTLGTARSQLVRITGKQGRRITYDQLKKNNGAAIFETEWTDGLKHSYLVLGWSTNGKRFGWLAINYVTKHTYALVSAGRMKWLLKHSVVWLFQK